ncbi:MAG: Gmad2 immunoglobulin-like domain-containing protein, partial [Actinomycetota bacterium]|nr:Gmad2 immunoglobulin-like domain-containing protein [Actinomycetota bacterium]
SSDRAVAAVDEGSSPQATAREPKFSSPLTREGGKEGAADRIRSVRFEVLGGYERAIIEFGGPLERAGRVPAWTLSRPAEGGYVRLTFPGLSSTATAGRDLVGLVMDEFYVLRNPDGRLFVDIFAIRPFRYRISEFSHSGRLVVDYRPAAGELSHPVVRGEKAVILQPREAEQVSSPLWVRGYSRHFEGAPTFTLKDRGGEVLASKTVRSTGPAEAWGYVETKLDFNAKGGPATLLVGERNHHDATFEGVEVPIFLEGD